MKYSNIPSSIIAKYSHILTGIVFTATSVLPLATSVMAQTAPALSIAGITRTHIVPASSEVVYRIVVKNTTSSDAYKVKVRNLLPTGFTYRKHLTTLQKGAVTFGSTNATKFLDPLYTTKPVAGDNDLVWDNITLPKSSSIEFIFTATASATASTTAYSMQDLRVSSYSSLSSTTPTTTIFTNGTTDDVTVKPIPPTPTLSFAASPNNTYDAPICAQPGAQGVGVELTGIVNTYFQPTMQSVAAGTSSITIAEGSAKGGTTTLGVTTPDNIKPGDLVLIVQMQDASISTANTAEYGSGVATNQGSGQTSMGNTGLYEYAIANSTVLAASGSVVKTLTLKKPLINSYVSAAKTDSRGQRRFQVIRVPQYASAKVLGTMFASPWDGNVGGILAVDAFGTFDLNGQRLSVNEAGFRGGFGLKNSNINAQEGFVAKTNVYGMDTAGNVIRNTDSSPTTIVTLNTLGSGKGEGVAGTPRFISTKSLSNVDPINGAPVWNGGFIDNKVEGYPGGDTGRGAPANAGGGANAHNAGGGGGGNGGNGGQGSLGYGYNPDLKDAGGRPGSSSLTNTPTPMKVFMGGGGGGGEANDSPQGVPGGAGGGIVMLRAGTIINTGSTPGIIYANGANGDRGAFGANPDGGGGGGAGGTVLIQSRNPTSASIKVEAKGGNGGNTERDSFYDYASSPIAPTAQTNANGYGPDGYVYNNNGRTPHGPGGGGAGGILLYNVTSTATIIPSVTGGVSGLTDDPSPSTTLKNSGNILLSTYDSTGKILLSTLGNKTNHSNGATAGSLGQIVPFTNGDDRFSDLNAQTACSPANLAMVVSTSTPNAAPGDTVSYKMKVTNPASSGGATAVSFDNQLPAGFTYTSTPSVGGIVLTGGATRPTETIVNPTVGSTTPTWGKFIIPPGATVEINFRATIGASVANGVYHDKAHAMYPNPLRISDTASDATITKSYGEVATETGGDITVKRTSLPMVWNLSPSIRIVRR
jgi:uncharacterized repeat protein (TIGR01451 family)